MEPLKFEGIELIRASGITEEKKGFPNVINIETFGITGNKMLHPKTVS